MKRGIKLRILPFKIYTQNLKCEQRVVSDHNIYYGYYPRYALDDFFKDMKYKIIGSDERNNLSPLLHEGVTYYPSGIITYRIEINKDSLDYYPLYYVMRLYK